MGSASRFEVKLSAFIYLERMTAPNRSSQIPEIVQDIMLLSNLLDSLGIKFHVFGFLVGTVL